MKTRYLLLLPWPLAILVWLWWFSVSIILAGAALILVAGGLVVWLIGQLVSMGSPKAGKSISSAGSGFARGVATLSDFVQTGRRPR